MSYLHENTNLKIEQINKLPFEEYMDVMGDLSMSQVKEYLSKLQLKESSEPMQAIKVDYDRNDERSGVDAGGLIKNLRERCKKKNER